MSDAEAVLDSLPGIFTYSEAREAGISDRQLSTLRSQRVIEQIARGLYGRSGSLEDPNLLEIARRAPNATLCLGTALARHQLSDEIPAAIDLALPRQQRLPAMTAPVRWHRFEALTFDIGREQLPVDGFSVGIYGPERSICDAFRLRHLNGYEEANEALKRWLRRSGSQPSTLISMAHHFGPRAETPIREALQLLL
jgi:predicted transcriptional regulator of viral defense system